MKDDQRSLLILGASTRAAAHSAVRSGLEPLCADRFADEDLKAAARVLPLKNYPRGLLKAAEAAPMSPWMYVGALENHPRLIARIRRQRPLWGNPPAVLAVARDPSAVARILREADLPALDVRAASRPPVADAAWMLKPLHSAGGRGIRIWQHDATRSATLDEPHYFQRRQIGTTVSALFLGTAAGASMIGIARQLVGVPALNASAYAYCGSVGPIELRGKVAGQIEHSGRILAEACRLRGLFGCDFVLSDGTAWLTEVNPRYTASVELYEFAYQTPLLGWHAQACEEFDDDEVKSAALAGTVASEVARLRAGPPMRVIAKAVLYTDRDVDVPDLSDWAEASQLARANNRADRGGPQDRRERFSVPTLADRPGPGTSIKRGQPVCTVLAAGAREAECSELLASRITEVTRRVLGTSAACKES